MVYEHKQKDNQNIYKCTDVFGEVEIECENQLEANILDEIVMQLIQNNKEQIVTGTIDSQYGVINFKLIRALSWCD
jgi:hypothetical protein